MTKEKYMALADLQTLWTNRMKPTIVDFVNGKVTVASVATCQSIIDELA